MSIAEKLTKVAENVPKVYEAGYIKGQESMVDESKIIQKTANGKSVLHLNDVSEIPHNVSIKLSSDTITDFSDVEVDVYGKNLLTAYDLYNKSPEYQTETIDGRECVKFIDGTNYKLEKIPFRENTVYTLSMWAKSTIKNTANTTGSILGALYYSDGTYEVLNIGRDKDWQFYSKSSNPLKTVVAIGMVSYNYTNWLYVDVNTFQLEANSIYTDYEPVDKRTLTPNTDGTVNVKSISPVMNMYVDETDVNISANYHKSYGMQLQYDLLWDAIQTKGTRKIYDSAFIGSNWDDEAFKPKYDFHPTTAKNMFRAMKITNLKASLESAGVVLDTSACTDFDMTFYYGTYGHIPEIDTRSATNLYSIFCGADAHTIDKWILKDDGSQKFNTNTFTHNSLKNLVVEGVIGQNLLSFANCTNLTHDSLLSILNALKDYSDYTGSTTWKITLGSKNIAKLTEEDKEIASSKGWVIA